MTAVLAALVLAAPVGDWQDTVPVGDFEGDVFWVQDYNRPWDWLPVQEVGTIRLTLGGGRVSGYLDLPAESAQWLDRLNHPVRFYLEKTPEEWRESRQFPYLFYPAQMSATGAAIGTGWRGQYTPYNIHAQWYFGISCLWYIPDTGLSFRWREVNGEVEVRAYGFWAAWPSQHYMSLGFAMRER